MIDKRLREAMDLRLGEGEKALLWQEILRASEEETPPPKEEYNMQHTSVKTALRILLIAAVLTCIFTVTASATDLLGLRAIQLPTPPGASESEAPVESRIPALVSVTQPQAIPEDLDPAVAEKVKNARAAWKEWREWKTSDPEQPREPAVFSPPEGSDSSVYEENEDGSCTIRFYSYDQAVEKENENGELYLDFGEALETRVASAEDMAALEAFQAYVNTSYGDYDFHYDVHSAREADKLEEIAAKYHLNLRKDLHLLWSKETVEESDAAWNAEHGSDFHTDTSDPRFLTNAELCERIQEVGCRGKLFTETPRGFDKLYYFDEGTFAVGYYVNLPSTGETVHCYGYNSVYATLSSGREIVSQIAEPEKLSVRTHTAPDGTALTILRGEQQVFLYAYLDNSFFEEEITSAGPLSDADVDYLADFLLYQNIG